MQKFQFSLVDQARPVLLASGGWWRKLFFLSILFAVPLTSMAMHEVNHRYEIWGQVVDGQGVAVANTEVLITGVAGMPLGKGETDVNGRYRIVLHIHNANIGLPFWVSANGTIRAAKVVFNASDQNTPRDHQVDIRPAESDS